MSDVVTTTGRRMSKALEDAIDGLPSRELCIRAFEAVAAEGGSQAGLHAALALELRLCQLREEDTLQRMYREVLDSIPEPPLPEATGGTLHFDPEAGESWID